jgi:hypothetical protein
VNHVDAPIILPILSYFFLEQKQIKNYRSFQAQLIAPLALHVAIMLVYD